MTDKSPANFTKNGSNHKNIDTEPWMGVSKAFETAYLAVKNNYEPYMFFVGLLLVEYLISLLFSHNPTSINSNTIKNYHFGATSFGIGIVGILFYPFQYAYQLSLAKGEKITIKQLFRLSIKKYLYVYLTIIMFIPILFIGALFILVPLIWILPWFSLAFYPVIDLGYTPIESLKYVRTITKGNLGKVWAIFGIYVAIDVAVSIIFRNNTIIDVVAGMIDILVNAALAVLYVWLTRQPVPSE